LQKKLQARVNPNLKAMVVIKFQMCNLFIKADTGALFDMLEVRNFNVVL